MKILRSISFAWNGLKICFSSETNFRIHIFFAVLAILLGIGFHISVTEWLVIVMCFAIVLFAELFNTAIEKLCDVVQPGFHPRIRMTKDISAGAVLVAAIASSVIGIIIFAPKIFDLVKSL